MSQREKAPARRDTQAAFSSIYSEHTWGSESKSGPGSEAVKAKKYIAFLQRFIKKHRIKSIVDIGCGDWSIARNLDLSEIRYMGMDVVPEVVTSLTRNFQKENIKFICEDATSAKLPEADLLIIKDVLQHWPNANVHSFLKKLDGFKLALLTNDYARCRIRRFLGYEFCGEILQEPVDIEFGECRSIKLREKPFSLACNQVLKFRIVDHGTVFCKETMLWRRRNN